MSNNESIEYMLANAFNHIPAGVRKYGDLAGEEYDEFWWRDCILHDGDWQGTQGYLILWWHDGNLVTHHTYTYPPNIYN